MNDDIERLIEHLAIWQTEAGEESLRDRAITALGERGPDVVPVLIERLEDLLAATAARRERVAAVLEVWDAWYDEGDSLRVDHGFADLEPYRTIPSESLPERPADSRDPYELKQGIIQALQQIGDQRAAPVITAALADRACVHTAARALREIHSDRAVPALLDAAALVSPDNNTAVDALVAALEHHGVAMAQARERFEAETSPQGRVGLMHLLTKLPDDGTGRPEPSEIRDSLVYLALDDRDTSGARRAISALAELDDRETGGSASSRWDAPPPADVIRSAIALAAQGQPPGLDRHLRRGLRQVARTPPAAQAVMAVLDERSPEPDAAELHFALELAMRLGAGRQQDPMRLIRAMHRLSSHPDPKVSTRALTVLRGTGFGGDLLFEQMTQEDDVLREEAAAIFEEIARPEDRARFESFNKSKPGRGPGFLRRLRRR